jgi:hypothetical protein
MFLTTLDNALFKDIGPSVKLEGFDILESLADFARSSVIGLGGFRSVYLCPG